MATEDLLLLVQSTPRERFVATHANLFFVTQVVAKDPVEFDTVVAGHATAGPPTRGRTRVVSLVKAAGNPYPDRISIGRARNCDVVIRDASVSKLHAHVRKDADGHWHLVDLDSHNGTRLNGTRVQSTEPRLIHPGDAVTFGAVSGTLLDADALYTLLRRLAE